MRSLRLSISFALLAVAALFATLPLHAQEKPFVVKPDAPTPQLDAGKSAAPAANCPEIKTIPQLLDALDEGVSGDGTKDFTCMQALFLPGARLMVVRRMEKPNAAGQQIGIRPLTIEQYIEVAKKRPSAAYEKQTGYKTDQFGNIAQVWTTYQISATPTGPATTRGVNSLQIIFDGKTWHIVEILWQTEDKDNPLPNLPPIPAR